MHTLHIIIFQDPYFPRGMVDLRYAISCDPYQEKDIRLRTNTKTIHLCADSVPSRVEWVKAIRRVIFKAQNMGDSVKVLSPGLHKLLTFNTASADSDTLFHNHRRGQINRS